MPEPDVSPQSCPLQSANNIQPRIRLPCAEVLLPSCASPINGGDRWDDSFRSNSPVGDGPVTWVVLSLGCRLSDLLSTNPFVNTLHNDEVAPERDIADLKRRTIFRRYIPSLCLLETRKFHDNDNVGMPVAFEYRIAPLRAK
jgi:hypothetical protein